MKPAQILSTACLAGLMACGTTSDSKKVGRSVSMQTQTLTMHQDGTYTRQTGKRLLDGNQLGELTGAQVRQVDCSGNDVLLVWGQTTVCFPGIWPADEALVINGTFEDPPLRLTFPVPLDGDAKPVRDVVWSADKLIVDGSPYDLVPGDSYVFTEDGLEALSSDAADER
ncbi:MAG TPA: hypothetical protein EYQ25_03995 [Planctomycetes bacterium]|nr:hypothetical protein [Planctomycetota bacterium]HIL38487.1 hypothetical protein [Planctomycetota bacterium]